MEPRFKRPDSDSVDDWAFIGYAEDVYDAWFCEPRMVIALHWDNTGDVVVTHYTMRTVKEYARIGVKWAADILVLLDDLKDPSISPNHNARTR